MRNLLIIGIVLLVAIALVRLISPEDKWICDGGKWVAHGNPSTEKPEDPCLKLF